MSFEKHKDWIHSRSVRWYFGDIFLLKIELIKLYYFSDAVAEFAITLTLSTLKRISESIEAARNGQWKLGDLLWMCGGSIFDSTVGIFGLGRIGYQIGERIKAFKPSRLLYHDLVKNSYADSAYEFVDLDTLLGESDIVICMCAVTPGTIGIFNMKLFQKMKPTGVFINCSRGVVVNQDDLCLALKTKTIAAAGKLKFLKSISIYLML
jgi:lactate dehydrogenase-like 2-hydroxyacid dehydrogenase